MPHAERPPRTNGTAPDRRRAHGEHARGQGPGHRHGVDALGEDPPRHSVAPPRGRPTGARVRGPAGVDDRRHPDRGLHPVRRLRLFVPVDGGRPGVHRPRGAGEGLQVRRRPARRADQGEALRPRAGPARHLRLHALLLVHRRLPEGRRADGPDHAAPPSRRRRIRHRRRQQRAPSRAGVHQDHRAQGNAGRVAALAGVLRPGHQGEADSHPGGDQGPRRVAADRRSWDPHRQDALALEAHPGSAPEAPGRLPEVREEHLCARRGAPRGAQPLHHRRGGGPGGSTSGGHGR